jgi:hypothetical protein
MIDRHRNYKKSVKDVPLSLSNSTKLSINTLRYTSVQPESAIVRDVCGNVLNGNRTMFSSFGRV